MNIRNIVDNLHKVIVGKPETITMMLTAVLGGGHVLLEDVPGVGKTMLVRTLAKTLGCTFKRIQFTPDLLPSDVTGVSIYNPSTMQFEFRPGPIMGQIILADEINRTSPKTQAALLEAMEERAVTVDGVTYPLPQPFFLIATQNPIEYEGTFPLPEAQLDRFMMKLSMGYPNLREESELLVRAQFRHPIEEVEPVTTPEELLKLQEEVRTVHAEESVRGYMARISQATRHHQAVYVGISPRGTMQMFRAAQAYAYMEGRDYIIPDDVKLLAHFVLNHRLILHPESGLDGITPQKVMDDVLRRVAIPIRTHQGG